MERHRYCPRLALHARDQGSHTRRTRPSLLCSYEEGDLLLAFHSIDRDLMELTLLRL